MFHLLQAAGAPKNGMMSMILMIGAFVLIMYFFMIRPQQKKQKELQKARAALKAGDKVVTAGGIHGRIREVRDNYFIIEIAENTRIKVEKTSVFISPEDATPEAQGKA